MTSGTIRVVCSYCGHDLSGANPVQYVNGEPICLICSGKIDNMAQPNAFVTRVRRDKNGYSSIHVEAEKPLSSDVVLAEVPILTDDNIQEL
jgi:hypothetical protein